MREVLSWDEYLLHLLNYRNCFLTVKLLPKFIKNSEYLFESPQQKEKEQEKDSKRKSLPNTPAISPRPGAVGTVVAVDEEEENDDDDEDDDANKPEIVKKNKGKYKDFYMSDIDYDGLPHPSFYQLFSFFYEQSKLTSCPIITTEVVKMGIEEVKKYVMLIVREGKRKKVPIPSTNSAAVASSGSTGATSEKEKFWFLTVYDPRNATEYQCGVKEGCQLHSQLYYHKYLNNAEIMKDVKANLFNVEKINEYLHSAAEGNMLVLGPAITPRLQFQLYNYKDTKCQELIGECQISISSVLSNSGVGEKLWITLIYKFEKSDAAGDSSQLTDRKKIVTLPAGEIEIELSFRRSLEMESDELLTKKSSSALSIKTTSPLPSVRPDQQIPRAKDLSRDQERIAELTQQNEKLLGELNRLRSTPRSDVPARVAASTDASRELANVPLVSKQKYDELEKQKNELQALYDALKEELRVQKQKAEALKVPNKVAAPAVERSVDESKYLELVQENKSLKEQNESLKLQLQLQQKSKPDPPPLTLDSANDFLIVSNSNGPMISTPQKEGSVELSSSLSLLPTFSVNVPQVIQQILTFLYKKCEKKSLLKANNGNLPAAAAAAPGGGGLRSSKDFGSMTASQILGSFHTLLKAVVNTEGFVSYKQIQDSLLEFQVFVENEIMIKIVHEILGNFNNMNQPLNKKYPHSIPLTDFISYLTSELNQLLKQSGLGSSASRSKLRSSLDLTNAGGNNKPPLASNDDVNLRGSFEKEESKSQHTVRPSSAAAAMLSASAPVGGSGDEGNPSQLKNRKGSRLSQTLKSKSSNQIDADDKEPEKHATEKETEKLPPRRYEEVEHSPKRGSNPVDWSKVPLPEQWERRFHQPKNRFLYIDHENKKTQWHHPKDSSHANTNTNANANSYADSNANANAEKKEEPQRVYQPASASARESEKKK